jgi:hypothetical protein
VVKRFYDTTIYLGSAQITFDEIVLRIEYSSLVGILTFVGNRPLCPAGGLGSFQTCLHLVHIAYPSVATTVNPMGLTQLFATGDGCWDVSNFLEPAGFATMEGEGVLILSACPELGLVPGSIEFAHRYQQKHGPILNYAINSYDCAMTLLSAMRSAALIKKGRVERSDISKALRQIKRQGIAYPNVVTWDAQGDSNAAVTALHKVKDGKFYQVDMMSMVKGEPVHI